MYTRTQIHALRARTAVQLHNRIQQGNVTASKTVSITASIQVTDTKAAPKPVVSHVFITLFPVLWLL